MKIKYKSKSLILLILLFLTNKGFISDIVFLNSSGEKCLCPLLVASEDHILSINILNELVKHFLF